jgi:hypothetical protein
MESTVCELHRQLKDEIVRVQQETGIPAVAIRLSYGLFDSAYEWHVEALHGFTFVAGERITRPPFHGFGKTVNAAVDDFLGVFQQWKEASVAHGKGV